jgi:hypothetical protein
MFLVLELHTLSVLTFVFSLIAASLEASGGIPGFCLMHDSG